MAAIDPTGRANILAEFRTLLADRGLRLEEILTEAGLGRIDLSAPTSQVPIQLVSQVFEVAARRTGDECFGLHFAEVFPAGGTGLLGNLVLAAPTVRDALLIVVRYSRLHAENLECRFSDEEGVGRFSVEWTGSPPAGGQYLAFLSTLLVLRIRLAAGPQWQPIGMSFVFRAPECRDEFHRIFGPRVIFDARTTEMFVDPTALARPMPPGPVGLFQFMQQLGESELAAILGRDLQSDRTCRAIKRMLDERRLVDLETVATELAIQPRALQWRLQQEKTTFDRVLTDTRRALAEQYLRDSDRRLSDIADLLGFSEQSAFTRAAKSWFGVSPRLARQVLRGAPPPPLEADG